MMIEGDCSGGAGTWAVSCPTWLNVRQLLSIDRRLLTPCLQGLAHCRPLLVAGNRPLRKLLDQTVGGGAMNVCGRIEDFATRLVKPHVELGIGTTGQVGTLSVLHRTV
jgi:hypothetical protein